MVPRPLPSHLHPLLKLPPNNLRNLIISARFPNQYAIIAKHLVPLCSYHHRWCTPHRDPHPCSIRTWCPRVTWPPLLSQRTLSIRKTSSTCTDRRDHSTATRTNWWWTTTRRGRRNAIRESGRSDSGGSRRGKQLSRTQDWIAPLQRTSWSNRKSRQRRPSPCLRRSRRPRRRSTIGIGDTGMWLCRECCSFVNRKC